MASQLRFELSQQKLAASLQVKWAALAEFLEKSSTALQQAKRDRAMTSRIAANLFEAQSHEALPEVAEQERQLVRSCVTTVLPCYHRND